MSYLMRDSSPGVLHHVRLSSNATVQTWEFAWWSWGAGVRLLGTWETGFVMEHHGYSGGDAEFFLVPYPAWE